MNKLNLDNKETQLAYNITVANVIFQLDTLEEVYPGLTDTVLERLIQNNVRNLIKIEKIVERYKKM